MGHKETVKDTARVLGRMYDAIEYRGFGQEIAEELAEWAGVPIYNGLTDEWHPTQILADFLTFREHLAKPLERGRLLLPRRRPLQHGGLVPDRRGEARDGRPDREPEVALAARRDRRAGAVDRAETGATITITDDVGEAVRGADVLLTDVWVSMGEAGRGLGGADRAADAVPGERRDDGRDRQPGRRSSCTACRRSTTPRPRSARRSSRSSGWTALEVTEEVFESPASLVFDEAENRLHTIKAVMVATLGG